MAVGVRGFNLRIIAVMCNSTKEHSMGVNSNNHCPICGSVYSSWIGNDDHKCSQCGNIYNTATETWKYERAKAHNKE